MHSNAGEQLRNEGEMDMFCMFGESNSLPRFSNGSVVISRPNCVVLSLRWMDDLRNKRHRVMECRRDRSIARPPVARRRSAAQTPRPM